MLFRHLIAQVSKVSFITSGSAWACNFVPPLCCQKPSSCIHCIWYATFSCCWWCCLLWCYCHHILMSLSRNNLISSWVDKFINTWSTTSPSVLWKVYSILLSWKSLYLCWWRAYEHLRYLETWKQSWKEICQSKTKMNLRADLQHTCVNDHKGSIISARRSGD